MSACVTIAIGVSMGVHGYLRVSWASVGVDGYVGVSIGVHGYL